MDEFRFACGTCVAVSQGRPTFAEALSRATEMGWGIFPAFPDYTRCPDCRQVKRERPPAVLPGQQALF